MQDFYYQIIMNILMVWKTLIFISGKVELCGLWINKKLVQLALLVLKVEEPGFKLYMFSLKKFVVKRDLLPNGFRKCDGHLLCFGNTCLSVLVFLVRWRLPGEEAGGGEPDEEKCWLDLGLVQPTGKQPSQVKLII